MNKRLNMQKQGHSYLDLSVLPELRTSILSSDGVVLFNSELTSIIWANASGARLFGGKGVADLLRAKLSDDQAMVRQIRNSATQLKGNKPITRGFRLKQGARSILLQFEIRSIRLPDKDSGILVTSYADHDEQETEENMAAGAVESLDGFADAAAILDDFGMPIASSQDFADLGPDEDVLAGLINELRDEDDRLIKRPVPGLSGNIMAIGLARLTDEPGRNLLVLADTNEPADAPTENGDALLEEEVSSPLHSTAETVSPSGDTGPSDEDEDTEYDDSDDGEETGSYRDDEDQDGDTVIATGASGLLPFDSDTPAQADDKDTIVEIVGDEPDETMASEQELSSEDTLEATPDDGKTVNESSHADKADETSADEVDNAQSTEETVGGNFLYLNEKEDVRFAWSIDSDGVFRTVSPELGRTVGPNSANILGRSWQDVSLELGLDPDGEVAAKFARQDTWSGKSVLWPVQGTDMSVPVDLAALPVFGADRVFEGFRGFGIIRTIDAVVDPEATGMALVKPNPDELEEVEAETRQIAENDDLSDDAHADDDSEPDIILNNTLDTDTESTSNATEEEQEQDDVHPDTGTPDQPEEELADEADNTEDNDKIIRLVPRAFQPLHHELSARENHAFEAIGEKLRDHAQEASGDSDNVAPSADHLDTSLMETLPVAILVYRTNELLFANQRFFETTGYDRLDDLTEAGGIDAILNAGDNEESDASVGQYIVSRDGRKIAVEPVLHTVPWMGDKALLLSFSITDELIIDEPVALEITTSSEIQNILDTASDGIVLMEPDGTVISINASAEALFGLTFDEATGSDFVDFFAPESKETVSNYLETLSEPGVESLLNDGRDVIATEKNGGLIPIFLTVSRMESSNKFCAVVRDMTSWKKVEEELIQSKRDAIRASEQKTDFLAHISHEIRTPLNAIIGFSDVMLEEKFGPIDNQRYRDYLRDINRSGSHVLELVNDLLDLSKIEAGKLELSFEAVELNQIVAETVALLQPQANSNRIIIRTSLSRAVPKVVADPRSIRQIILNLVSNAIKFSPPNSQVIVSTLYESNGEVAMRVRDTGDGMTKREIEEAMKPFNQLHSVSERAGEGTGLGLPLTKALVEANRALFDLESEPGTGTIAHVQFPTQRVLTD